MIAIEGTKVQRIYTSERLLCPECKRNNNFMYIVKKDGDKYYLGEKCPKCEHYNDFRSIPSRMAVDYPTPQK